MSSREPLWFCHECNAEMHPLMTPDPVCASCHGSFVEKMDDMNDDPREFHQQGGFDDIPPSLAPFLQALTGLMDPTRMPGGRSSRPISPNHSPTPTASTFTFQVRGGPGGRSIVVTNPPSSMRGSMSPTSGNVPTMSEFLRRDPDTDPRVGIGAPLMAQYLRVLMGRDFPGMFGPMAEDGQMGDYVFNQEALDRIITQIMENSNASRPVPATDEIVEKLPREVLEIGSSTLEKDCAVCKEQFQLETEDPDEQVIVTLPCKHPFHEPCILPWLKSSGTCPVCRYALIPQPEHHPPPTSGSSSGGSSPSSSPPRGSPPPQGGNHDPNGLFQSLFGFMDSGGTGNPGSTSRNSSSRPQPSPSNPRTSRPSAARRRSSNDEHPENNIPGHWDNLD